MLSASVPVHAATRVLIIGEAAQTRTLVAHVMGGLGYAVDGASSGREGWRALGEGGFDLVLLSLDLSDMSGLTLAQRIRAAWPGLRRIPILAFGRTSDPEATLRACFETGIQGFLGIPLEIARLTAAARRLTDPARRIARQPLWSIVMPSQGASPPIDLGHLDGFTDGDAGLERELCALYLKTAAAYLDEMTNALRDGREWSAPAHGLKGASANIGARDTARLAAEAEKTSPDAARLQGIRDALGAVTAFVHKRHGGAALPQPARAR